MTGELIPKLHQDLPVPNMCIPDTNGVSGTRGGPHLLGLWRPRFILAVGLTASADRVGKWRVTLCATSPENVMDAVWVVPECEGSRLVSMHRVKPPSLNSSP